MTDTRTHTPLCHSIRWRLLLSYAGIALLAAVALGGLLLLTLRSYYDERERDYMRVSAELMIHSAEQLLQDDAPEEVLQAATGTYAFMALARVRLLDADHQVLADSDTMLEENFVSLEYHRPESPLNANGNAGQTEFFPGGPEGFRPLETGAANTVEFETYLSIRREELPESDIETGRARWRLYPLRMLRGTADRLLTGETSSKTHNALVMKAALYDHRTHEIIGYVELSEGPAFGTEIVNDVAQKAVVAGVIAVFLAAVAGWFTSRRISQPVLALAATTGRMAKGDLSVRADVDRRDELGLLAQTFNTMAARVETTVVTLKRFVADAAHAINTPITALQTNLELAAASDRIDEARKDIVRAQSELARLEMLTQGLLTLARIEAHESAPDRQPVDLATLSRQMHERYASRADQAGITLRLEVPPGIYPVKANEVLIISVIENLLDNALKFTPEHGTVTLGLQPEAGGVRLWVADDGIGIPPDDVPKLFSRFYRASNAAAYPGNGLGLVITRTIVEDHGGTITVESAAGRTRFIVQLPC